MSAAIAADPRGYATEEHVSDLATLISLCCLYDRLVMVGPGHLLNRNVPLFQFLRRSVLEVREVGDADWRRATEQAEKYANQFLKVGTIRHSIDVFQSIFYSRDTGIDSDALLPDTGGDIMIARELLHDVKDLEGLRSKLLNEDDREVISYALRTFFYIGLSDRMRLPVAIDAARQPLISEIVKDSQERLREAVLSVMRDALRDDKSLPGPVRTIASPFAAIVFSESKDREDLVERISSLREEHTALRLRIQPLEQLLADSHAEARDEAQARLSAALDELRLRYSTKMTQDLRIHRIVASAKPLAEILSLQFKGALENVAARLIRKDSENTFAELHQLKKNQPSTAQQDRDIQRLFDI